VKHPVKTLAALAILGAVAPSAHAVSIKDDVMSITPTVRIQTRAQISDATSAGATSNGFEGTEYRVNGGNENAANDALDFSLRRARLGLDFKYGTAWKGRLQVQADNVDRDGYEIGRPVTVRYGWVERGFALSDGMAAAIKFGLDKAEQNASDRLSSSRKLMPNDNASSAYLNPRGVGVGARFQHPMFMIAADILNNMNGAKDTGGGAAADSNAFEQEGFFYGLRAEFSFSPEWFIAKRAESFVGKEGHGLNIGLSYGVNQDAVLADVDGTAANAQRGTRSQSAYSLDAMLWLNGLSAWAEYRAGTVKSERNDGVAIVDSPTGRGDLDAKFITLQVGYAFPLGEEYIEPAIRYQIIDNNTDLDEFSNFGSNAETGASGTQIDLGVNYYLSGHDNKLSLALSLWEAEEGEGDATIIRLQHQINF
jgi:hypothetical protein